MESIDLVKTSDWMLQLQPKRFKYWWSNHHRNSTL